MRAVLEERFLRYELEDEAAAYPVTIDPYVTYSNSTGGMDSVYIGSGSPDKGFLTDYLCTGVHTAEAKKPELIALLKPRSLVPQKSSDTILSAKLYMRVSEYGGNQWFIGAFPVKTPWTEKDTTWNSMSPGDDTHISKELLSYISNIAEQKWGYFDITETYKSWYRQKEDGSHSNYGVAIRRDVQQRELLFDSCVGGQPVHRRKLRLPRGPQGLVEVRKHGHRPRGQCVC